MEKNRNDSQERLVQEHKTERLELFSSSLVHDFNNIFAAIEGYAAFLVDDLGENKEQKKFALNILDGAIEGKRLIEEILSHSRHGGSDKVVENINDRESVVPGIGNILVVEDQEQVRTIVMSMLERLGYKTDGFPNAEEALDHLRENPDRYVAVLTDQIMPGMTGLDLARDIAADFPDLPVVLMTGHGSRKIEALQDQKGSVRDILQKPVSSARLSQALSRAIKT